VEYSWEYYLVRSEIVYSRWTIPTVSQPAIAPLGALGISIEGRYRVTPGFYVAARGDHLGFSDIRGTTVTEPWDAPVSRFELGGGYSLQRNLLLKSSVQVNMRDGGREHSGCFVSTQVVYWF
jgi:hypothetical protein